MTKESQSEAKTHTARAAEAATMPPLDSTYRLIIVAAQRSRQLQRGARPRVEMDMLRHKPTRVALQEVRQGMVPYALTELVS